MGADGSWRGPAPGRPNNTPALGGSRGGGRGPGGGAEGGGRGGCGAALVPRPPKQLLEFGELRRAAQDVGGDDLDIVLHLSAAPLRQLAPSGDRDSAGAIPRTPTPPPKKVSSIRAGRPSRAAAASLRRARARSDSL